jgi:8-oxo-dGTP diphosphatase
MNQEKNPITCVGVMIFKKGKVLVGKRRGRHGDGEYSFVGGKLEYKQSLKECVVQETLEEAGIKIKNIEFLFIANSKEHYGRHDVLVGFTADWKSGEPIDNKEERVGDWQWCDLDRLPEPMFYPAEMMVKSYKSGKIFYDKE